MRGPFRALAGAVAAVRTLLDTGSACGAVQQGLPCWRARNAPAGVAGQWLQQTSGHGVGPPPCVRSLHSTAAIGSGSSTTATADQKQRQQQQHQPPQQQAHSSHSLGRSAGSGGGGGRGRAGGSGTIAPPLLTARIKGADSLSALQQLEAEHGGGFNHIHAAAAFTRTAHLVSSGAARPLDAHPLLQRLSARLRRLFDDCDTRQHANTLWACGKTAYVDAALLDACFERLAAGVADAAPQGLANALYAAALLQAADYGVDRQQATQLLSALVTQRQAATPQALANTLWAAATLQLVVPEQQAAQLLSALVAQRQAATPQALANALWAAATLQLAVPEHQAAQLLSALVAQRQAATPQDISNALWAMAKQWSNAAPPDVEAALLRLAAAVDERLVAAMNGQGVSNSMWALSQLGLRPALLTQRLAAAAVPLAPAMNPQDLANTAAAAARLGVGSARLFAALAGAAGRQAQGFTTQALCNLAWALAIADQRQLAGVVVALAQRAATAAVWAQTVAEDHCQLHQVHLWLLDGQRADSGSGSSSSGLAGALTAAQLQQCKEAWEAALQEAAQQDCRSAFERSVFECARRLPGLADCRQEARTPDGAFSVDVAALHAGSGLRLAIEADGPTHFLRPGREVSGDTLARNRALSARGCVVVSVPYWEWAKVQRDGRKAAAYLSQAVEDAVARWRQQGGSGSGGGNVGGRSGEAAPAA
ncbi:hypothetical protein Rsub_10878 [Raphidocelis subcapitata]|uniref:RAP domain-containing protein n=1 Tax=Raphidocelis subcapitata TaxID=307507 RepID=A0A2V0PCY8_9CHLO|nr:hypothetical protein Rsub_10878 [Raphidocelis subcapitata]|eukprot:GBF97714.1 hypothetical protein Rsub_10878 [Raphidocelis subcapitata]